MLIALMNSQNKQKEREARYYKFCQILAELTKHQTFAEGDFNAGVREITQTAACTLEVERVSVWLCNADYSKLECIELYQRTTSQHMAGMELQILDYPAYHQVLEKEQTIATVDASNDPITKKLSECYLSKLGIKSMLNAPIYWNGKIVGIICIGHVGSKRQGC